MDGIHSVASQAEAVPGNQVSLHAAVSGLKKANEAETRTGEALIAGIEQVAAQIEASAPQGNVGQNLNVLA